MSQVTIFENAFLIDGTGADPVDGASVVVEGRTIKEVSDQALTAKPAGAELIDLKGKTLMPGLIDGHIHAANIYMNHAQTSALSPAVFVCRTAENLEADINLGFTTVRDAGGLDLGFRQAIEQGYINGPRTLLSVNMLTQSGGHGDKRSPFQEANQPRSPMGNYPEICDGVDEVKKAARNVLRRGADQVKVMADGGVASPTDKLGHWQFEVDELEAAVTVAKAAGTYVMAHVYADQAVRNCVAAGVKTIEHGNLITEDTARLMAEKGTWLCPTLTTYQILAEYGEKEGLSPFILSKMEQIVEVGFASVERAVAAGVKIASGSDIIGPYQFHKGRELGLKAQVMGPMAAIVAATKSSAEMIELDDRLGTVEAGRLADLIVVRANPLEDLTQFHHDNNGVVMVLVDGKVRKREI